MYKHIMLFVSCVLAVVIHSTVSMTETSNKYSVFNSIDLKGSNKDIIRNADDIIALMKRKSKKYLDEIGGKWIIGEKFNKQQIDCLLSRGRCLKDMQTIKETLVSALRNNCETCTDTNKQLAGDALLVLLSRQEEVWKMFVKNYRREFPDAISLKDWL